MNYVNLLMDELHLLDNILVYIIDQSSMIYILMQAGLIINNNIRQELFLSWLIFPSPNLLLFFKTLYMHYHH